VQHWVLRLLCALSGAAPWRYARFLDYAAERILLRRVGGSYIFVHRMLLEYFAGVETITEPVAAPTCTQCGKPHKLAARFCPHCGKPFDEISSATARSSDERMSSATARLSDIEVQKRHSRWGIASTVMGFLSIVLAGALWGLAAYAGNSDNPTVNTIVVTLFIAGGFINLTGLVAGFGSVFQRNRKRLFPIVGVALNLLVFLAMCGVIALALIAAQQGG
jgi:hypothetical protein